MNTSIYKEGWNAYWDGIPRNECPYSKENNVNNHEEWIDGWVGAMCQDERNDCGPGEGLLGEGDV